MAGSRQDTAVTLDRENQALALRRQGATYDQVADRLGIAKTTAYDAVHRALTRYGTEAAADVRRIELERLDELWLAALTVLRRTHPVVQSGKIVMDSQGRPLTDDGPTLAAIRTLVVIGERRAKLLGLDAPTKHEVKIQTIDELDAEIADLEAQLATNDDRDPQPADRR